MEGYCRTPRLLWPDLLDDDVTEENPVRFIEAYGERRELEHLGFARAQAALTGRPADAPRDLLKLSIDGDLTRLRSRRRRERETHRHVERIGLLRQLRPEFKTMADFRTNPTNARHALFREFVLLCKPLKLFGAELLAIDGRKFKAVNSQHKNCTQAKLEKALKAIDAQVEQYVRDLDAADREESRVHQPTREELQEKIERLQERQKRDYRCVPASTASGEPRRSLTDPESRARPKSPKVDGGDNVQSAVDSQQKLLVAQDVTTAITDDAQLSPMAIRAQETLGVERMTAVANMGDDHGHAIKVCEEAGLEAYAPKPSTSANTKLGLLGQERFTDDSEQDCYRCPRGEERTVSLATTELGRHLRYSATGACRRCPLKEQGTSNTDGRRMTRWIDAHVLERMEERLTATPKIMPERTQLLNTHLARSNTPMIRVISS